MTPRRNIELSELQKLFHLTEKQVAKELGVCLTSLKKICRQHGIHRWPYRKVWTVSAHRSITPNAHNLASPRA